MLEVVSKHAIPATLGISGEFVIGAKQKRGTYLVMDMDQYFKAGGRFTPDAKKIKARHLIDFSTARNKKRT